MGVVAGERVPVITDRNPHLENISDSRRWGRGYWILSNIAYMFDVMVMVVMIMIMIMTMRCVYLPYSDEANMVVDLPNMAGMFFTTQRLLRLRKYSDR